jgi:hypothetical protein
MKVGDLVYYATPIGLPNDTVLGIVLEIDERKETAIVQWLDNMGKDIMPLKWLIIISHSK